MGGGVETGLTVTVVEATAEPPVPVTVSVSVPVLLGVMVCVPDTATEAPLSVAEVALALDQVSVVLFPAVIVAGEAVMLAVGTAVATGLTVTVVELVAESSRRSTTNVYLAVSLGVIVFDPESATACPLILACSALVLDHVSFAALPATNVAGVALIDAVMRSASA